MRPTRIAAQAQLVLRDSPREGVVRLTLNRPTAMNALSLPLLRELRARVGEVAQSSPKEVRALVIAGAGRAFSAGHDLKEVMGMMEHAGEGRDGVDDVCGAPRDGTARADGGGDVDEGHADQCVRWDCAQPRA